MLKKGVKYLYFLYLLKYKKLYFFDFIKNNNYLILLNLHKVSPNRNLFYPSLQPRLFEELIRFLKKEFNIITFDKIDEFKNSKKPNIILSFDDGFYDFLEYAMPIMERYRVKANQNVIPHSITSSKPAWDVQLGDLLNQVSIEKINSLALPGFNLQLNKSNASEYSLALTAFLKRLKKDDRDELWKQFDNLIESENVKLTKMLNLSEVKDIAKIHEIGAHSFSHESMAVEGDEFFKDDFKKCKEFFDKELHLPLDIYAFPSGSYTQSQIDYLQKNGIKHILLVNENYSNYNSNIYERFTFYGDSVAEIKLRALGWRR